MTPQEFVLEHWKVYEAYIEKKERLIEVATTIYLAFASAMILRDHWFWRAYKPKGVWVLLLLFLTLLAVLGFVAAQMGHRARGASISNASQTMMTRWLAQPPQPNDLAPVSMPGFVGVELPQALADEIRARAAIRASLSDMAFEIVVYGLILLWAVALFARVLLAWSK